MRRHEAAIADQPTRQQGRRVAADGALAVSAGYVDGLPWELNVFQETGNALEAGLDHSRGSQVVRTAWTAAGSGRDVLMF